MKKGFVGYLVSVWYSILAAQSARFDMVLGRAWEAVAAAGLSQ
jgi:hypothetical protein